MFAKLAEVHALAATFKGISTWTTQKFSEQLKQACGGHGYLQIAGLARNHVNFGIGVVTAEGDNTVLAQQTAMHLLGSLQKGKIDISAIENKFTDKSLKMENRILGLFELRWKSQLKMVAEKVRKLMEDGKDFKT